jgi:anti-anti-sigma factor
VNSIQFKVDSKLVGTAAVIYPRGYLNNLSGESLVTECNMYIQQGIKNIIVNFQETDFINSIGISLILSVIEDLKKIDGRVCFSNMSKLHQDTFEMLGLLKFMHSFSGEIEALQFLSSDIR